MPGTVSEPFGDPARGDSEQWVRDTLAQVVDDISALTAAVAELAAQQAEQERRATAPGPVRRAHRAPRRGDTFLRVVRMAAAVVVGLGLVILTAAAPARIHRIQQQRYAPQCTVACASPAAHHSRAVHQR